MVTQKAQVHQDPMVPEPFLIEDCIEETHDTFTVVLKPPQERDGFTFKPGQFNMLYVFGGGEVPISISGDPEGTDSVTHTTRVVGSVTRLMRQLKPGDTIGLRGPFGSQWPMQEARGKDVIVVTGGIGLAPLRPVIYQLLNEREKYRRLTLLYGTRTPRDILYAKELHQWRSHFDMEVYVTVDNADKDWRGNVGVVTSLIPRIAFDIDNVLAMVCGPEIMMNFTVRALRTHGLTYQDIYISMERNMKCAVGFCGHCQYGPYFICKDGPVFRYDQVKHIFKIAEI